MFKKDCYEVVMLSLRVSVGLDAANNLALEYNTRLTRCYAKIC